MVMQGASIVSALATIGAVASAASCDALVGLDEPRVDADASAAGNSDAGSTLTVTVAPAVDYAEDLGPPLSGAQVALDAPGGQRIEQFTGSDGSTTFSGVDWSLGSAAVTVYHPGYALKTEEGLGPTASLSIAVYERGPDPFGPEITISGPITGAASPTDYAYVTASAPLGTSYVGVATDYSFQVSEGTPFSLIAVDVSQGDASVMPRYYSGGTFLQWRRYDEPAESADATIGIDFEAGVALTPTTQVVGSIVPPNDDAGAFAASSPSLRVTTRESALNLYLGGPTQLDVSGDGGSFVYAASYVAFPGSHPLTIATLTTTDGQSSSQVLPGYPQQGQTIDGFLLPQHLGIVSAFDAAIPIEAAPAGASRTRVYLVDASTTEVLWVVGVPSTATHVFFPPLPSGVAQSVVIPAGTLSAYATTSNCPEIVEANAFACPQSAQGNTVLVPQP
jgi:hypothetical protein